ncbi:MAG TPA: hypothetical protein VKG79_12235 [Bryobacteraceae bacterium]|nr:hypothetical protein [Bryobacteraceae bacterium]
MFCSECGKQSSGKFCWNCGAPLHVLEETQSSQAAAAPAPAPSDWRDEISYDVLIRNSEVRDLLAKQKPPAYHMTGEEFVEGFGKLLPVQVPLAPLMNFSKDLGGRLGIHTGKSRAESYARPAGQVIVAALCTLARDGYKIQEARQATDGCVLICEIPSDFFSLAATLMLAFHREQSAVSVHAEVDIQGQMFDWGKSNRCLTQLFNGIAAGV